MAIYIDHVIGIGKRYWYVTTLSYGFIPLREGRSLLGLALARKDAMEILQGELNFELNFLSPSHGLCTLRLRR